MIADLFAVLFFGGWTVGFCWLVFRVDRAYRAGLAFRQDTLLLSSVPHARLQRDMFAGQGGNG
ncbi:hypothetical protein [Lysobacter brunescens]|uniref:Uncharacterized protein n=1 Tax=Lysobacter brunescens TaxID=262323 RepID=A0ABW2YKK8_9GAMM